jgi:DNA-binding MarR family transcriptional regulator
VEVAVQKHREHPRRNLEVDSPPTQQEGKRGASGFEAGSTKIPLENAVRETASLSPLKLFPGISFSMMFRFLVVSRIYRHRMALFCRKNYDLEPNLLLILTAASEGHVQQGILARSLGINKNAMVFLIDDLGLRGLIRRVENPDNRREKFIECTNQGRQVVTEIKRNYAEIARWGLYPLSDPQIEQFGALLAKIIDGESSAKLPPPILPKQM